jgi:hypothetical protein
VSAPNDDGVVRIPMDGPAIQVGRYFIDPRDWRYYNDPDAQAVQDHAREAWCKSLTSPGRVQRIARAAELKAAAPAPSRLPPADDDGWITIHDTAAVRP